MKLTHGKKVMYILSSLLLPALSVVLGMQLLRVYLPGVLLVIGERFTFEQMGLFALGTFLAVFLAPVGLRLLGVRRFLALSAGGLAVLRLVEQFVFNPMGDTLLAAAGVIFFLWFFPAYTAWQRANGGDLRPLALGLVLGLSIDTVLKGAAFSLDLSWQTGFGVSAVVAALCGLLLWALTYILSREPVAEEGGTAPAAAWPLLVIGPYLFLELIVFRNLGRVQVTGGLSFTAGFLWLHLGGVLLLLWFFYLSSPRTASFGRAARLVEAAAAAAVLILAVWELGPGAARYPLLLLPLGQLAAGLALFRAMDSAGAAGIKRGLGWDSLFAGLGLVILAGFLFYYYSEYTLVPEVLPLAAALTALAGLASAARAPAAPGKGEAAATPAGTRRLAVSALVLTVVLVLLPIWTTLVYTPPQAVPAVAGTRTLTLMTYNIQMGFDVRGRQNLEGQAQAIEAAAPDLVALQEVSRGWTVNSSVDTVGWLSRRLNMPYVYAAFSGDLWGQALLSRYPLVDVEAVPFPDNAGDVGEGLLAATVVAGEQRVRVIASHFSAPIGGRSRERVEQIRLEQALMALRLWDEQPCSVIMGDLNSETDSPPIRAILDAGFTDPVEPLGPGALTSPSDAPRKRIDLILITPDLVPLAAEIPQSRASDHRPVVVTVGW